MPAPILAYHLVTDTFDFGFARTNIKQFKRQMAWLHQNGYETLTLSEYAKPTSCPPADNATQKRVILTFDDAYASLASAAEIMAEYGFIGTCFAISDYIGRQNDWDYQFCLRKIHHASSDFLVQLLKSGWEIGSHSKRHSCLTHLQEEKLLDELKDSREHIAALLGTSVRSVSYPFGFANQRVCKIAKSIGYDCGVGLGLPLKQQLKYGSMCLPRLGVYLFDSISSFRKKVEAFQNYNKPAFILQQLISSGSWGTITLNRLCRKLRVEKNRFKD